MQVRISKTSIIIRVFTFREKITGLEIQYGDGFEKPLKWIIEDKRKCCLWKQVEISKAQFAAG
jgi:hypothetical protein